MACGLIAGCQAPENREGALLSVSGPPERLEAFEKAALACGLTEVARGSTDGVGWLSARVPYDGTREYQCAIQWLAEHPETFGVQGAGPVRPTVSTPTER